jgi:hypothetical protein
LSDWVDECYLFCNVAGDPSIDLIAISDYHLFFEACFSDVKNLANFWCSKGSRIQQGGSSSNINIDEDAWQYYFSCPIDWWDNRPN